jgi:hypothetical protein
MPDIGILVEMVLARLSLPRVGFLWMEERPGTGGVAGKGFFPVHYRTDSPSENPGTDLFLGEIEAPEREAATLSLLVVLPGTDSLLSDLISGFPKRPCARLVAGCLDRGVPVLCFMDRSNAGFSCVGAFRSFREESLAGLERMGLSFFDLAGGKPEKCGETGGTCVFDRPGWYSWADISHFPGNCRVLRLGKNTRLTAEARERLQRQGVLTEVV